MGILKFVTMTILLILCFSCGKNLEFQLQKEKDRTVVGPRNKEGLQGELDSTNGKVSLGILNDKITMLVFAQDTCEVCIKETELFISHLPDRTKAPKSFNLLTILIGAQKIDADDFKDFFEVPWTVAFEEKANLFKKYCPKDSVPCVVIHDPKKGIVLRHHGALEFDEIKKHTGEWQ